MISNCFLVPTDPIHWWDWLYGPIRSDPMLYILYVMSQKGVGYEVNMVVISGKKQKKL